MTLKPEERSKLVKHRLIRARETEKEALLLFKNKMFPAAVNRIYYSMFHALSALALKEGFETGKHGQLIGWFNQNHIKAGLVDTKYSKMITRSFEKRMDSDYDDFPDFLENEVKHMLDECNEFIKLMEDIAVL